MKYYLGMEKRTIFLVPTYKTPIKELEACIESLLSQTVAISIMVYSDGDEPGYIKEARSMLNRLAQNASFMLPSRSLLFRYGLKNEGVSVALNRLHGYAREAGYKYAALSGASDLSDPRRIEEQLDYLKRLNNSGIEPDVIGTQLESFKGSPKNVIYRTKHAEHYTDKQDGWYTNHGTALYDIDVVQSVGEYDPALRRAQDIDLWRRLVKFEKKIYTLNKYLYLWRK